MANEVSLAERNATSVSYDVVDGETINLDMNFVARYLVRGRANLITAQEIILFMNTCKQQKLNPLANEAYLIKYSENEPAQTVVGKSAYMRRAYENPDYIGKEDGITVVRGDAVLQKEGTCMYPGETLVGGWCRIHFMRNGRELSAFKELAFNEYNKGMANWKSKPATMINKCAVSQCIREAFPKDYEGLYSEEEMVASGAIPSTFEEVPTETTVASVERKTTQEERQKLLAKISAEYSEEERSRVLKDKLESVGCKSLNELTNQQLDKLLQQ